MLILLLLTILLIFAILRVEYNIDQRGYFSQSILDNPDGINYSEISNFSLSPLEEFCNEKNMRVYVNRISETGCMDDSDNKYPYDVIYKDDFWIMGNKTYKAIWQ